MESSARTANPRLPHRGIALFALVIFTGTFADCSAMLDSRGADTQETPADEGNPAYCRMTPVSDDRFLKALNHARFKERSNALFGDGDLQRAAYRQATSLAGSGTLSHDSEEGGPSDRLRRRGLVRRYVAENIARLPHGAEPVRRVFEYWMRRDAERASMLHPRYRRAGLALAPGEDDCYFTLILTD